MSNSRNKKFIINYNIIELDEIIANVRARVQEFNFEQLEAIDAIVTFELWDRYHRADELDDIGNAED